MATLSYQSAQPTGVTLTLAAASVGGDKVAPSAHGCLVVRNGDASSTTVTIATPGNDEYNLSRPDITLAVAAGATAVFGPLPKDLGDPSDGNIVITYSKVTSLTVGAFTL